MGPKIHSNFESGEDFGGFWGSFCPKRTQKYGFNEKIGVICVPEECKNWVLMRKLGLFASQRTNFCGSFWRKNGVDIFWPIQDSHPCLSLPLSVLAPQPGGLLALLVGVLQGQRLHLPPHVVIRPVPGHLSSSSAATHNNVIKTNLLLFSLNQRRGE